MTSESRYELNGREVSIGVDRRDAGLRVTMSDGREADVRIVNRCASIVELAIVPPSAAGPAQAERRFTAAVHVAGSSVIISFEGRIYRFQPAKSGPAGAAAENDGLVIAPCGGIIVDLSAAEGQAVAAGDPIAVIEAMKVMTPIDAPRNGVVRNLATERGRRVEQGAVLARIEAPVAAESEE